MSMEYEDAKEVRVCGERVCNELLATGEWKLLDFETEVNPSQFNSSCSYGGGSAYSYLFILGRTK